MINALEEFQATNAQAMGPIGQARERGSEAFRKIGLPNTRLENWKYTDIDALRQNKYTLAAQATAPSNLEERLAIPGLDQHRLVFVNNIYQPALSSTQALGRGANLTYCGDCDDTATELLGQIADIDNHNFAALNQAFLKDFVWLNLEDNAHIDLPIYLFFLANNQPSHVMTHPRILVTAGKNTRATLVEHYVGTGKRENLTNTITEVQLHAGAQIEHYRLQEQSTETYHFAGLHANLGNDARLVSHSIDLGGLLVRNDIVANLGAPGASVILNGFYMAGNGQHVDNHTCINHLKPHTDSLEDYRGVIDSKGRGVFNGKVVVSPNAQKIEAHQSNNNLLLSEQAEIDTKPELEIYADDVKCSHGATIGQLDKDALFYLRSRGIGPNLALSLLTFAFAESVIGRLDIEAVRERMEAAVVSRLPDQERIKEFL